MSIFDIIGPVMIGPSSSHTAGMVKLGRIARAISKECFGKEPNDVQIILNEPLRKTYKGHGTYQALIAGTLFDYKESDERIPKVYEIANEHKKIIEKIPTIDGDKFSDENHPNSIKFVFEKELYIIGSSLGGGRVKITNLKLPETEEFDDLELITGEYLTLVVFVFKDSPGIINLISKHLSEQEINIPSMKYHRKAVNGNALFEAWLEFENINQKITIEKKQEIVNQIKEHPQLEKCKCLLIDI